MAGKKSLPARARRRPLPSLLRGSTPQTPRSTPRPASWAHLASPHSKGWRDRLEPGPNSSPNSRLNAAKYIFRTPRESGCQGDSRFQALSSSLWYSKPGLLVWEMMAYDDLRISPGGHDRCEDPAFLGESDCRPFTGGFWLRIQSLCDLEKCRKCEPMPGRQPGRKEKSVHGLPFGTDNHSNIRFLPGIQINTLTESGSNSN